MLVSAAKEPIKIWDVNVDSTVISKLVKTKTNSKYLIWYSDKATRPLALIMSKMTGYVKTFKIEDKNNKLKSFSIYDKKLLEKHKASWTKIEDFKNIKLNAWPVYDDRYIKIKIRTYGNNIYTSFSDSNVPEDDIDFESFIVNSIDFLLVNILQIILVKIFLKIGYYKCCITIKLIYEMELITLKVTIAKSVRFVIVLFSIMNSNFKILYAMVAMTWQC